MGVRLWQVDHGGPWRRPADVLCAFVAGRSSARTARELRRNYRNGGRYRPLHGSASSLRSAHGWARGESIPVFEKVREDGFGGAVGFPVLKTAPSRSRFSLIRDLVAFRGV